MAITLGSCVRAPDAAAAHTSQALESTDGDHGVEFKIIFSRPQGVGRALGPMGSRNGHLIALGGNFHPLSAGTASLLFWVYHASWWRIPAPSSSSKART